MYLAKVKKRVVSTIKHPAYNNKKLFVVSPVTPDGKEKDREMVAMDYLDVGIGDIVVCGGAPGVAKEVFNLDMAPIRTLIIARVDRIIRGNNAATGN
jgi:microcompartment protein CcmK/EutM